MGINELIEKAPVRGAVKDSGILVLADGILLDRKSVRIVKDPYFLSRTMEINSIDDWFKQSYGHGKDLVCLARKYNLGIAVGYELNVIKQDIKNVAMEISDALKSIYWRN